MSKTDKIIELKKLLDSGLISQSDFDRLKKQIFEGGENVSNEFNKISQSEFNENIQQKRANDSSKFDESIQRTEINDSSDIDKTKRCPQCGSDNAIENSECEVCKTDFSFQGNKNENYVEIEHESNNSKYLIFGILAVLFIVIGAVYFSNSNKSNNNQETNILLNDSISASVSEADTISLINQENFDTTATHLSDTTKYINNLNIGDSNESNLVEDEQNNIISKNQNQNFNFKQNNNTVVPGDLIGYWDNWFGKNGKIKFDLDGRCTITYSKSENFTISQTSEWYCEENYLYVKTDGYFKRFEITEKTNNEIKIENKNTGEFTYIRK